MAIKSLIPPLIFLFFLSFLCVLAVNRITTSNPLFNGQSLSSPSESFELGFFNLSNSRNLYVGIWYKQLHPRAIVWVANKERPVTDPMAHLTIRADGSLVLLDSKQKIFWSCNTSLTSNSSFAELLDNGNFILKEGTSGSISWQSFDHPCDTLLTNASIIFNRTSGEASVLTSWRSSIDPSPGEYTFGLAPHTPPQIFIWKAGRPYWRSGPWSGSKFLGIPDMNASYDGMVKDDATTGILSFNYYYTWFTHEISYMLLSTNGSLKAVMNDSRGWHDAWSDPKSPCDIYGVCGPFGVCSEFKDGSPVCKCLKGYTPSSEQEWKNGNWTGGCKRRRRLLCERNESATIKPNSKQRDRFSQITGIKLPDFHRRVNNIKADAHGCQEQCLSSCSCYAFAYFGEGIGCLVWTTPLVDMVKFPQGGEDLFVRLSHTEYSNTEQTRKLAASLISVSIFIGLVAVSFAFCRWRRNTTDYSVSSNMDQENPTDIIQFDYRSILAATNNFSMENKLGQGGFGPVYKGVLKDGTEIAVKRLSSSSGQGVEEFKNEITLISKLQHRNLVRLLGCCIEKEERLLVYENMVNKSLDGFLFDPTRKLVLDWPKRFTIIKGIARGLLYLHRDSLLRIIHRDLKVSNILLDEKMDPKISDFGLARIFEATQDLANTGRVVGTLGYMSPEYALGGIFSEKSDVFSFGMLLLEIVSGHKTSWFNYDDGDQTPGLLSYAWLSWCENKGLSLADQTLDVSYSPAEVMRCVNIALLCVQDYAIDRPTMPWVVSMLTSETELPKPKKPTFTFQKALDHKSAAEPYLSYSVYDATESLMIGR